MEEFLLFLYFVRIQLRYHISTQNTSTNFKLCQTLLKLGETCEVKKPIIKGDYIHFTFIGLNDVDTPSLL